ncbi:MAG: adenylate/guanylate cyclase domain-containing protein [Actinomycetota bacterium]
MTERPSGTVTFLFTDVAGSTELWESDPEGMARSLAAHDRIVREAIAEHGGYVFATGGDSYSASFPTAGQAAAAATAAQLALQSRSWDGPPIRVRMGIHTGVAEERDGDYFGVAVSRAARIMGLGHGGQIIMSAITADLLGDSPARSADLVDRGSHRLKGLVSSERVFELRHPDLPEIMEPVGSGHRGGSNLPEALTSFVGRTAEMEGISELLHGHRLITLTGVGGTGKTRLALEVARRRADRYPDGVWMAELAPVTDPDLVINQIADIWGLRAGEGTSLLDVLVTFLEYRKLLLVVDNCEHVVGAVSELMSRLLRTSPELAALATSRESLGVEGEMVFQVPSLGLPVSERDAADSDAVKLFLDRLEQVRPGTAPTPDEMSAVVRICRRLDGIPLGLELAAARMRTLSPLELADRLEDSFRILAGGSKAALPRQRTLQATIDWSHDLLTPAEATVFRRLSVFAGGFDLEAAEAVGPGGEVEAWEVLDLVDQLVDKSLVVSVLSEGTTRFRMLEPIRQYARERLAAQDEATDVPLAHARHYASMLRELSVQLRSGGQGAAHAAVAADLDNIRSALTALRSNRLYGELWDMCFDLTLFWGQASMAMEALEFLLPALESNTSDPLPNEARAWFTAAMMAFFLTDPRSVDYADRGLQVARLYDDPVARGWLTVIQAAATAGTTGASPTAVAGLVAEGASLVRDNLRTPWWDGVWDEVLLDFMLGFATGGEERLEYVHRAMTGARAAGDEYMAANGAGMAYVPQEAGDARSPGQYGTDPALDLEGAVRRLRSLGYRHALGHTLIYWGHLTKEQRQRGMGESAMSEGSEMLAEVGDVPCSVQSLGWMIESQLERDEALVATETLARATRLARLRPDAPASLDLIRLSCLVALAAGDPEAAAGFHAFGRAVGPAQPAEGPERCHDGLRRVYTDGQLQEVAESRAGIPPGEMIDEIRRWADRTAAPRGDEGDRVAAVPSL